MKKFINCSTRDAKGEEGALREREICVAWLIKPSQPTNQLEGYVRLAIRLSGGFPMVLNCTLWWVFNLLCPPSSSSTACWGIDVKFNPIPVNHQQK